MASFAVFFETSISSRKMKENMLYNVKATMLGHVQKDTHKVM